MLPAEIRRPAEDLTSSNRPATPWTPRILSSMKNEIRCGKLLVTLLACNDLTKNAPDGSEERSSFPGREAVGRAAGMNARLIERLIDIKVAETGDQLLGHEQRFDRRPPHTEPFVEIAKAIGRIERIGTEATIGDELLRSGNQLHDSEESRIAIRQMAPILEIENDLLIGKRRTLIVVVEIPGHPEMQTQPRTIIDGDEEMFAMPPRLDERPPAEASHEHMLSCFAEDAIVGHADADHPFPERVPCEVAAVILDFR